MILCQKSQFHNWGVNVEEKFSIKDLKLSAEELGEKLLKITYSESDPLVLREDFKPVSENPFIQWERLEDLLTDTGIDSGSFVDTPSPEFIKVITYGVYEESGFEIEVALIPANLNRKKNPAMVVFKIWGKDIKIEDLPSFGNVWHLVQIDDKWEKDPPTAYQIFCKQAGESIVDYMS